MSPWQPPCRRPSRTPVVPILRIHFDGGPWNGTVGNQQIHVPADGMDNLEIYTRNPLIGCYRIVPNRPTDDGAADYRAIWLPADF